MRSVRIIWYGAVLVASLLLVLLVLGWRSLTTRFLVRAVEEGDSRRAEQLLRLGADPNATEREQITLLARAAAEGRCDLVTTLLAHGASPNEGGPYHGFTPLMYAAYWGHREVVRILLYSGADMNLRDEDGQTPFFIGSGGKGSSEFMHFLLENGADPTVGDRFGRSPLWKAAVADNTTAVSVLLALTNRLGVTELTNALQVARERGHTNVLRILDEAYTRAREEPPSIP